MKRLRVRRMDKIISSSWPDRVRSRPAVLSQARLNPLEPIAQHGSRLTGVNEIVHAKTLGAGIGRTLRGQTIFNFPALGFWIWRGFDLAAVGDRDAALDRQRTAFC